MITSVLGILKHSMAMQVHKLYTTGSCYTGCEQGGTGAGQGKAGIIVATQPVARITTNSRTNATGEAPTGLQEIDATTHFSWLLWEIGEMS